MESLERTPTPREMLFSLQQHLQKITSDTNEFYSELSKRMGEEAIAVDETDYLAKAAEVYDKDFIATTRDEEGEVVGQINLLEVLKNKFGELENKIKEALDNKDNFGALINLLEAEQRQIHDDALFEALFENSDTEVEGSLDVLTDWYDDLLAKTISIIDRVYREPEFDLK